MFPFHSYRPCFLTQPYMFIPLGNKTSFWLQELGTILKTGLNQKGNLFTDVIDHLSIKLYSGTDVSRCPTEVCYLQAISPHLSVLLFSVLSSFSSRFYWWLQASLSLHPHSLENPAERDFLFSTVPPSCYTGLASLKSSSLAKGW